MNNWIFLYIQIKSESSCIVRHTTSLSYLSTPPFGVSFIFSLMLNPRFSYIFSAFLFIYFFLRVHFQWCSGPTLGFAFRDHSQRESGYHCVRGIKLFWLCATSQVSYPENWPLSLIIFPASFLLFCPIYVESIFQLLSNSDIEFCHRDDCFMMLGCWFQTLVLYLRMYSDFKLCLNLCFHSNALGPAIMSYMQFILKLKMMQWSNLWYGH